MKKPLLFGIILTACVVIVTFVFSLGYPGGMISYWKFDEGSGTTADDIVGTNDGALVNQPTWVSGRVMNALDFTTTKHVQVAESASLEPETITVEAWIKSDVYPGYPYYIVSKYLKIRDGCCSSYALYTAGGGVKVYIARDDGGNWIGTPPGGVVPDIWDGKWHHVAGTFNGAKLELYIDGLSAGSTAYTAGILYSDSGADDLFIGSYTSPSLYNFPGGIDEVAIYNRALSAEEIQQHYQDGLHGLGYDVECVLPPDGLVSWWPGDGDVCDIHDGNNGTLMNGATFAPGMVGQAFSLDGSGYVEIPNAPSLTPAHFTLDAWVKPVALRTNGWDSVISHGASGSGPLGTWLDSYWLGFFDGKPRFHTAHEVPLSDHPISGPDPVTLNEWHHIAGSFDGITKNLYLDGNLVASTEIASPIVYEEVPVLIGEDTNGNSPAGLKFRGLIDEVEIYDRALDASEIQNIYLAGSAGKCKVIQVTIDIKPGSYPNSINLGSKGSIPVAILSSACFDATTVAPDTVELAGAGVAVRGKGNKYMAHEEDVNGDLLLDLVVQVETESLSPASFQDGIAVIAVLIGKTYAGMSIKGSDEIIIVKDK